jgi:hypothetical protein
MGILVVVMAGLYFLLSVVGVLLVAWFAKLNEWNAKRWFWGAVLVMYLIPFWDLLPTIAVHQYYCATQSGFWVYKTLEQWNEENPGVMETLVSYNKWPSGGVPDFPAKRGTGKDGHEQFTTSQINKRFEHAIDREDISHMPIVMRTERTLVDMEKNEVIARYIGFSSGYSVVAGRNDPSNPWKAWLRSSHCFNGKAQEVEFGKFYLQFKGVEK